MHDELQDQVVYGEYQIRYLENEIINEQRYRQRVRREEKQNHKRMVIFTALTFLLGFGLLFLIIWELFFSKISSNLLLPISLLILLPIQFFMAVFLAICICKLVKYAKRIHGDVDWKTFTYMHYTDMNETSQARERYLHQELIRTELTHKTNQELLEQRKAHPAAQDMKVISMEELVQIRDECADQPAEAVDVKNMGRLLEE